MPDPVIRCRARAASYQLLSIAFAHPIPEITGQLADGRFQSAFAGHMETAFGRIPPLPRLAIDPSDFGSAYIALFERGGRGRPPVPLCAGEYMQLLDGRPRPEVLLEHTRFYRHFGLKVRGHGEDNELPDHLCCQLEAMAWLGELEARTRREAKPTEGRERAQADFLDKLLIPFLDQFVPTLELELSRRGGDPLFAALGAASAHGKAAFAPENQWVVVMSRALGAEGMHMASLDPAGDPQPLAFAVWQGAGGERDGHKNASTGWIFLDLSPLAGS